MHYQGGFERDVTFLMDRANETRMDDRNGVELEFLREHGAIRGLERHVVAEFDTVKQAHFEAVMGAQHDFQKRRTTERWKHIKNMSLANSLPSRFIAVRFAQNDEDSVYGTPSERTSGSVTADLVSSTSVDIVTGASPEVPTSLTR